MTIRRTPIRRISAKRQTSLQEYSSKRQVFLARLPKCEACKKKNSTEVHHKNKRIGKNFLDETTWCALCHPCHVWVHENPSKARAIGLLK